VRGAAGTAPTPPASRPRIPVWCPGATHTPALLDPLGRQRRSARHDAVVRHRLASPSGPTSRLRHGWHVAPERRSPQGAWFEGDIGTSAGEWVRLGVLVLIEWADGGHGRVGPVVLQRPRRRHTGVALPGRSHVRVRRPTFMLCLVPISGIRCFAVFMSIRLRGSGKGHRPATAAFLLRDLHEPAVVSAGGAFDQALSPQGAVRVTVRRLRPRYRASRASGSVITRLPWTAPWGRARPKGSAKGSAKGAVHPPTERSVPLGRGVA